MPFILVYEPKEGLRYWVQGYLATLDEVLCWRINGLRENAYKFDTEHEAEKIKKQFLLHSDKMKLSQP